MKRFFENEKQAILYRLYRPTTPDFVASDIVRYVEEKRPSPLRRAVDVGCGSGQNTFVFAKYFDSIIGTDISSAQVAEAEGELISNGTRSNVRFAVASAYDMTDIVPDHSVDLIVGAMCFHWFDLTKFYAEVRRILAPNGVVASIGHVTWDLCHPTDAELSKRLSKAIRAFDTSLVPILHPTIDEFTQFHKDQRLLSFEDEVRVEVEPQIKQQTLTNYLGSVTTWHSFNRFKDNNPEKSIVMLESLKKNILKIYGYDESMDPDKAIVHTRFNYYYVMARVSDGIPEENGEK